MLLCAHEHISFCFVSGLRGADLLISEDGEWFFGACLYMVKPCSLILCLNIFIMLKKFISP